MSKGVLGMRRADVIVIVIVLLLAAGASVYGFGLGPFASAGDEGSTAVVRADGREVARVALAALDEDRHIEVAGPLGTTFVELGPGFAAIVDSPCPDKLCVRQGRITAPGQTVVCLPNRVSVEIVSGGEQLFDAVSR